jgi:hypothetical protein
MLDEAAAILADIEGSKALYDARSAQTGVSVGWPALSVRLAPAAPLHAHTWDLEHATQNTNTRPTAHHPAQGNPDGDRRRSC